MKRHTSRKLDEHACGKVQGQSSRTSISTESSTEVSRSLNSEGHFHQQTMFDNDHPRPVDSAKQLAGKKRPSSNSMAQPPSSKRLHSGTAASKVGKRKTLHHESKSPSAHMQSQAKRARFEEESQRKRQSLPSNSSSHINLYSRAVDNFTVTEGANTPKILNPPCHQENNTSTEVSYELTRANTPISSNHAASKVACKQNLLIKQTPKTQPTGGTSTSEGVKAAQPNTPTISAKTRTSGQSSGNKGFSRTSTPTSTDLDKALGGHTTKKTSFDKTNADIQSSSIENLTLPVVGVSDSGGKVKKGGVNGKKDHAQSDQPLTVTRKTNKFKVFPRSKPRPQLKSKTSGDARVRRSRCSKAERHRCPSCSRHDCGTCKNCL